MAESKILQKKNQIDIYQRVLSQRAQLRKNFGTDCCWPSPENIKKIIVVLGSSRSGSSLLYHLLAQHPDLISLQGEEVTFARLFGLNEIKSFNDSDELPAIHNIDFSKLGQEILFDSGYTAQNSPRLPVDRAQRLLMQWPEIEFDLGRLMNACKEESWEKVIEKLRKDYPSIELARYDHHLSIPASRITSIVEEPPFIVPGARQFKDNSDDCTLLLKSSINAFRAELLQSIFPNVEFQFIHLTRHPAAAINGLIDGWLSPAFHTHHLGHLTSLSIKGYDDKEWWKFDLPQGWSDYTKAPLENVCAFQWTKANESIGSFLKDKKSSRITYEELSEFESMKVALQKIASELSLAPDFIQKLQSPRTVMSVIPPQKDRWKTRADLILPLVRTAEIKTLANSLGYEV